MCGKFTQMASWAEVHAYADLFGASVNDSVRVFTPMRAAPVVHLHAPSGERLITPMTWGFTDRAPIGRRSPKHMHARGETVHRLPTFREAFAQRRGITFAKTFNEGKEIPVVDDAGDPTGKMWTQQWTIRPTDGRPILIGVIFDAFETEGGRGRECEFVQVTTPANALIATITDRMPLLLREEDVALWLGEDRAPIEEVMALIRTVEFDAGWEMTVEDPAKKPPRPRSGKPKTKPQGGLF